MFRSVLLIVGLVLASLASVQVYAQTTESIKSVQDSTKQGLRKIHSPKKAIWMSAILPGAGQVYNRKWWKVPIIYGALGGLSYGIAWNHSMAMDFKSAYLARVDGDPNTIDPYVGRYSDSNLRDLRTYYQRNRDLCIIFTTVVYVLNLVDATVDAHLYNFDVSEDLSMRLNPCIQALPLGGYAPTIGVVFSLR